MIAIRVAALADQDVTLRIAARKEFYILQNQSQELALGAALARQREPREVDALALQNLNDLSLFGCAAGDLLSHQ